MKAVDISREMLSAPVYPGDPSPSLEALCRLEFGDVCNTSSLHACLHNGTHMDAPRHFVPDGTDAAHVPLDACIGECSVVNFDGLLLGAQAEALLPGLRSRVLFKGKMELSPSAAFVLADSGLRLDEPLTDLVLLDQEGAVYPGQARIREDGLLEVWNDQLPRPAEVRLGYANWYVMPLFNGDGLPASPFRIREAAKEADV